MISDPASRRLRSAIHLTLLMLGIAGVCWSVLRIRQPNVSGETAIDATGGLPVCNWPLPRMIDVTGRVQQPGTDRKTSAVVFVFLATQCPISNGSLPELARLHAACSNDSVEFLGVITDRYTTRRDAAEHQREFAIPFPVVLDTAGTLQRQLQPTHSPQAVVVARGGDVVYSGRIDDRYQEIARPRSAPSRSELADAIAATLQGRMPTVSRTEPVGCLLEPLDRLVRSRELTFCREVAPIVFTHCANCHRDGEATPFALQSYEDVSRRASQIAQVVGDRVMPPWHAKPGFGHFLNERRLTDDEISIIQQWVANGAPRGDVTELPPLPDFGDGWQLGEPDLVLEVPEAFDVPADGPDIYQHFVLPTGLKHRALVKAFEFRPGDASVVHHAWLYFDTRGVARELDAATPEPGYGRFGGPGLIAAGNLGGWGPGGLPRRLPDGMARSIPGNSDLILQVHYHPTGKPGRDRSRVGLYFAHEAVDQLVTEIMVADVNLNIPAGEKRHCIKTSYKVPVETDLLDASPHMHLIGREICVTATTPDGREIPLIWIDNWNFYWQDHYVFESPVRLPAGSRIDLTAWYDNSADNPANPHSPPRDVRFGEASDDEMGICYFQATCPDYDDVEILSAHASNFFSEMSARYERRKKFGAVPVLKNSLDMQLSQIPSGEFEMGATDPDRFGASSRCEGPAHRVRVSRPFWMSRHEVTVGQFREFVAATGYRTEAERDGRGCNGLNPVTAEVVRRPEWIWSSPGYELTDDHPVVCVSWEDAQAFCRWLSKSEGRTYRLPTEAEWEYACRAGRQSLFSSGDDPAALQGFANTGDESLRATFNRAQGTAPWRDGFAFSAPVGSFEPNDFGLFDMHGNVGEWCADWFTPGGYSAADSGAEPEAAQNALPADSSRAGSVTDWRVVRGGSWFNTPTSCRSSGRHDGIPTARSTTNGFRVVLTVLEAAASMERSGEPETGGQEN